MSSFSLSLRLPFLGRLFCQWLTHVCFVGLLVRLESSTYVTHSMYIGCIAFKANCSSRCLAASLVACVASKCRIVFIFIRIVLSIFIVVTVITIITSVIMTAIDVIILTRTPGAIWPDRADTTSK